MSAPSAPPPPPPPPAKSHYKIHVTTDGLVGEIQKQLLATRLGHCYNLLPAGTTPRTKLSPLTRTTARLLVEAHKSSHSALASQKKDLEAALNEHEDRLQSEVGPGLQTLLDSFGPQGAFVKGPVRSPKDAILSSGRWEQEYRGLLIASPMTISAPPNDRLKLFYEAAGLALRYTDAREVIRSFILSTRILQDIIMYLEDEDELQNNFVLREWEPAPVDAEFRLFVVGDTLTAISQYLFKYYSARLVAAQDSIRDTLISYHTKVIGPSLKDFYAKYNVDVTIRDFESHNVALLRPQVIEVNSLVALETAFSGEALFFDDRGKKILLGNAKDVDYPVIRVQERPQGFAFMEKAHQNFMARVEREAVD